MRSPTPHAKAHAKASVEASWIQKANTSCGTIGGPVCPADAATLKSHVLTAANQEMAPFGSVTNLYIRCDPASPAPSFSAGWTSGPACSSTTKSGELVSVRTTYSWSAFTPIISSIMGNITASGSTTMSIN